MKSWRRVLCLLVSFVAYQSQSPADAPPYLDYYRQAEKLYQQESSTDRDDSIALHLYKLVVDLHRARPDTILRDANYKAGIYLQTAGKFQEAIRYLQQTIDLGNQLKVGDSLQYLPHIYLGNSYYSIDVLDSAVSCYRKAEHIADRYPGVEGLERLYNTFGVINYQSGNYPQSIIYFEKSLAIIENEKNINQYLFVNYKNNLASSLRKSGEAEKALNIYRELLAQNINRDELMHNIGSIYLERGEDSIAIDYLSRISYNNAAKYNDLALANLHLEKNESARGWLKKAYAEGVQKGYKNLELGLTCKYIGDLFLLDKKVDSSLHYYQRAIGQLIYSFNENDLRKNPVAFEGQFFVSELFETLVAKAHAFSLRYSYSNDTADLKSSIDTYETLNIFTQYVSHTYDSEKAKLMLSSRRYLSHQEPIENCVRLYSLTQNAAYIEKAFMFDESNKASVLTEQLHEQQLKHNSKLPPHLLQEEKKIKESITRENLVFQTTTDSVKKNQLQGRIRDLHIDLAALQRKFEQYEDYRKYGLADNTVSLKDFQKLIPENYAVLSFHLAKDNIVQFLITNDKVQMHNIKFDAHFTEDVIRLHGLVQRLSENNSDAVNTLSSRFYEMLIAPVEKELAGFDNLMIIPDDELNLIVFEMLADNGGKFLIEKYGITYNYSSTLVAQAGPMDVHEWTPALALAPFVNGQANFSALPASKDEIAGIDGKQLLDRDATKENFIRSAGENRLIHLATHAAANDAQPSSSFIAFYPAHPNSDTSYRLYASEIFNLTFPDTRLVVLSACETGAGQLVKGEGVMSLARAFAYAGCPNLVTSLWKADDQSTSSISRSFYKYLREDNPPAESLRLAVSGYLDDASVPVRKKQAGYWAHLRYAGGFSAQKKSFGGSTIVIIVITLLAFAGIFIFLSRSRAAT